MTTPQSGVTPGGQTAQSGRPEGPTAGSWSGAVTRWVSGLVPQGQWLPDRQPAYVASWIYVFGVACLASLVVIIASGLVLTLGGITWWHTSSVGHFFNSIHLWSVELFFATMVIHLWGKFFMAAWRGRRGLTWATGALAFFGSLGTAFTGYLMQTNFDSQWITTQAKDGLNAAAIGAWFNVMNVGQMVLWHVSLLPLVVGLIVAIHLILVRRKGVVPPIGAEPPSVAEPLETEPSATEPTAASPYAAGPGSPVAPGSPAAPEPAAPVAPEPAAPVAPEPTAPVEPEPAQPVPSRSVHTEAGAPSTHREVTR